jgi:uncharacterized protein YeaO (DUF488 family)
MPVRIKRAYDAPDKADGRRYLVDRLWPRGVTKAKLRLDGWLKDIAPSDALRRAYHGEKISFAQFRTRYRKELDEQPEALADLKKTARKETVTLLTASRNIVQSHADVLAEMLTGKGR